MPTETKKITKVTKKTPAKVAAKTPAKVTKNPSVKKAVKANPRPQGFSIIETGGKQYKVAKGDTITIEKLPKDFKPGDKVVFDKVLLAHDGKETKIGTPYLAGKKVEGKFEEEGRGKKVIVLKFKSKVRYRKKYGHRQPFVKVTIK